MITCAQCRDELAEYALGPADAAQRDRLEPHLAACPVCRQELEQLQADWSALPLALPPIEPNPQLFGRIEQRIGSVAATPVTTSHTPTRRERLFSYAVAVAVFVALSAGLWRLSQPSDADAAARRSAEKLAERLGNLQEMERLLATKNVRMVSLHSTPTANAAEAFLVWDLGAGQGHFYASNLPAPPSGQVYQLWIIKADDTPTAGPTFTVNEHGLGSVLANLPAVDIQQAKRATVTLEPRGGSPQPTGKVCLEAAL